MTFGDKVIKFHSHLKYTGSALPEGIRVINPFTGSGTALKNISLFSKKYLDDNRPRHLILGINPGRFGGAVTGIPFTDTKRLVSECKIPFAGKPTHEISSVFIYEMINAMGGVRFFYRNFYINSPFPLALIKVTAGGKEKNYNYYDSAALASSVRPFMIKSLRELIALGVKTDRCFCLGTGKNADFLNALNAEHHFFKEIIPLEHPRFIMQYKSSAKQFYIDKYVRLLNEAKTIRK
ncbi:MAG: DUF4918 domain-containing protein [Citrobacter freundii]|nr:MAG: DUF4918 domain-containing protein [Citrobacter freundii]